MTEPAVESTAASPTPFFRCACGRSYVRSESQRVGAMYVWEVLPDRRTYVDSEGSLVERRRCLCGSHVSVALLPALSVAELRRAVRLIDGMNESINDLYTALEMLLLVRACWLSEWDIAPDGWTPEQRSRALSDGQIPSFTEGSGGYHAVGVSDCRCRGCRASRDRFEQETA